ncbi:MAG TPA: transposase [Candidatus Baltobacteraceae bacterium]|nr:transposase [Candidatus Baltobacteraceae bacterium]
MSQRPAIDFMRRLRGWTLSKYPLREVAVLWAGGRPIYRVPSETHSGIAYDIFFDEDGEMVCSCPDFGARHRPCKHCVEVLYRFYPELAPPTPSSADLAKVGPSEMYANARRFKPEPFQYRDGPAEATRRDRALASEPERVQSLLLDLASVLNARFPQSGAHRHALAAGDRVLALVLRDYHRRSLRTTPGLLAPLSSEGRIAFAPCRSTLISYMQELETLSYLYEAHLLTTAPFRLMEQDMIVDSTCMSPFYFESYRAIKYGGRNTSKTEWFRIHLMIGRISHVVLAFEVTPAIGTGTGDISHLSPLLNSVEEAGFDLRYVIADNGYLDGARIDDVARRGARLVTPLKGRNFTTQGQVKSELLPLKLFANQSPEIYDELTRVRQIIEGVFSTEKRRSNRLASIGTKEEREQALRGNHSGLYLARVNEFYIRMIRYNLTRINVEEHLRNRYIRFSKGSLFSHVRETVEDDDVA